MFCCRKAKFFEVCLNLKADWVKIGKGEKYLKRPKLIQKDVKMPKPCRHLKVQNDMTYHFRHYLVSLVLAFCFCLLKALDATAILYVLG